MTQKFKQNYDYLLKKYNSLVINTKFTADELDIEVATFACRRHFGIDSIPYIKIGNKDNSKVVVLLVDLAYHMTTDTRGILDELDRKKYIEEYLKSKYKRVLLGKKDFSNELGIHLNTLGKYMQKGYISFFVKDEKSKKGKVTFNIHDIGSSFSVVVKTM